MENNEINKKFVDLIRENIEQEDLIATLMSLLSLGKGAVYRRLRSEIPFTFNEIVKISIKMGISLDWVIGSGTFVGKPRWAVVDMNTLFSSDNYFEKYHDRMVMLLETLQKMMRSKNAKLQSASNAVPYVFMLRYQHLSHFRLFKWIYLAQRAQPGFSFSKMKKPITIEKTEALFLSKLMKIPRMIFVLPESIFSSLIKDISFFYKQDLISETDLIKLRDELSDLISQMEYVATKGRFDDGPELTIYLSGVNLDSTYIHLEFDEQSYCLYGTHFVDALSFNNPLMCQRQKGWIESMKRYSSQISQSGEKLRFEFFEEQRKLLQTLTN